MCGLVGAVAQRNVMPVLMDGLRYLEYRGYDSAGLAFFNEGGSLSARRCVGKVRDLEQNLEISPLSCTVGLGHTRWATHGQPEERNAHPQLSHGAVAVVHNGIIENYEVLRSILIDDGYEFQSDTDTEVIAHLVHLYLRRGRPLLESVHGAVQHLSGAFAIAVISAADPGCVVVAAQDSPLVIGVGENENFVASEAAALLPIAQNFIFLQDGDVAAVRRNSVHMLDAAGNQVMRRMQQLDRTPGPVDKGEHPHYMLKEIHEQPQALTDTLEGRLQRDALIAESLGLGSPGLLDRVRQVHLVASGSSYHAAEVARQWIEALARVPCNLELASEYRHRVTAVPKDCLFVALSQSGETADTLAALRHAQGNGYLATLAVCNTGDCSLAREADLTLQTRAGPEIGVAATKTFTTQLLAMLMLTMLLARRGWKHNNKEQLLCRLLVRLAPSVRAVLEQEEELRAAAGRLGACKHALVLARGALYPIAREGALKLKEICYLPAEATAAGELKHGPLALVGADMPVIVLAPTNALLEKIKGNIREVQARRGKLIVLTDADSGIEPGPDTTLVQLPRVDELLAPVTYAVALQLLAYHLAVLRGTDVDQPRHLAKSVAVE